jgi:hypothetical protein
MARTSAVSIVEWGTPPEEDAAPKGWAGVRVALAQKVGKWANVGEFSHHSARTIRTERLPEEEGYEVRAIPTTTPGRVIVWVRLAPPA